MGKTEIFWILECRFLNQVYDQHSTNILKFRSLIWVYIICLNTPDHYDHYNNRVAVYNMAINV